jgi:hypothetical protein
MAYFFNGFGRAFCAACVPQQPGFQASPLVHKDLLRRLALWCSLSAIAIGASGGAHAGQLQASAFQTYHPTQASSIVPGAFALFVVPVSGILPTQINEGLAEVGKKTASFDGTVAIAEQPAD